MMSLKMTNQSDINNNLHRNSAMIKYLFTSTQPQLSGPKKSDRSDRKLLRFQWIEAGIYLRGTEGRDVTRGKGTRTES